MLGRIRLMTISFSKPATLFWMARKSSAMPPVASLRMRVYLPKRRGRPSGSCGMRDGWLPVLRPGVGTLGRGGGTSWDAIRLQVGDAIRGARAARIVSARARFCMQKISGLSVAWGPSRVNRVTSFLPHTWAHQRPCRRVIALVLVCASLFALLWPANARADAKFTKGPYLLEVAARRAVVRVEVDPPTPLVIDVRPASASSKGAPVALRTIAGGEARALVSFALDGLEPSMRYRYDVRT